MHELKFSANLNVIQDKNMYLKFNPECVQYVSAERTRVLQSCNTADKHWCVRLSL